MLDGEKDEKDLSETAGHYQKTGVSTVKAKDRTSW